MTLKMFYPLFSRAIRILSVIVARPLSNAGTASTSSSVRCLIKILNRTTLKLDYLVVLER